MDVESIILKLDELTEVQRDTLRIRFCGIVKFYKQRVRTTNIIAFYMHFFVTVGSLIVPALLSIQSPGMSSTIFGATELYWSTWTISLFVTISNGILNLFKIDKKYYSLNTVLAHLQSEGWQYIALSGKYSGHLGDHVTKPTHKNQFVYFCSMIEKITMRQIQDEYYKVNEDSTKDSKTKVIKSDSESPLEVQKILSPSNILPPSPMDMISMPSPEAPASPVLGLQTAGVPAPISITVDSETPLSEKPEPDTKIINH
jgi:hypothetical protein